MTNPNRIIASAGRANPVGSSLHAELASDTVIANGTPTPYTTLCSITLSSGTWDVSGWASMAGSGASQHLFLMLIDGSSTSIGIGITFAPTNSGWYTRNTIEASAVTGGQTITLVGSSEVGTGHARGTTTYNQGPVTGMRATRVA